MKRTEERREHQTEIQIEKKTPSQRKRGRQIERWCG